MTNVIDSAKATSEAVRQHGLAVVLSVVFSGCLVFFAWSQWQTSEVRADKWRELQQTNISDLNKKLDDAQEFTRTKLVDTIDRNSAALEELVDEIRD